MMIYNPWIVHESPRAYFQCEMGTVNILALKKLSMLELSEVEIT